MTNTNFIPEILAPCGSYEILIAAVKAGADACYIGGNKFGARAYATNLDTDSIVRAIDYAHSHNTSLYLTVNTLLKNNEISELYNYMKPYYEAGLDAVIVQDLGVFSMVKKLFPDINIHCSTQMNITSVHAASFMKNQGASRIVTAREMSLEEIRKIKEEIDIEIETFVHGAMCYSYSGQCLMSSLAGGRSGNRGRCAQPCRKCYDDKYLLSMKDMCALEHIPSLVDAGIDSLKIEGRMKNEYYVASAVDAYKELCLDYASGVFSKEKAEKYKYKLANIYNRGGFCDGYFFVHNGPDMISVNRPNNQGVLVGTVNKISDGKVEVKLKKSIYKGDVLELKLKNNESIEITSGIDGVSGKEIMLPAPKTKLIALNKAVYRTRCNYILDDVAKIINNNTKIPVKAIFSGIIGETMSFSLSAINRGEVHTFTAFGNIVEKSTNRPTTESQVSDKLKQMGDTEYFIDNLEVNISENAFIPASVIKNLRREAIAGLEKIICESYRRESKGCNIIPDDVELFAEKMTNNLFNLSLNIGVKNINQLKAIEQFKCYSGIYMDKSLYIQAKNEGYIDSLKSKNIKIYIELPYVINADFMISDYLQNLDINGIYIRNIDGFACVKNNINNEYEYICGSSLYAYNDSSVDFFNDFIPNMLYELPKELNNKELIGMKNYKKELTIYEYQQVMLSAQCVKKTISGCNKAGDVVKICDDKGNTFYSKAFCDECVNVIYNGIPLVLFDKLHPDIINSLGLSSVRINFTLENETEVYNVLNYYETMLNDEPVKKLNIKYTTGHFNRGVD